jgi:DNA-binding transcriptional ArsR family regulator
MKPRKVLLLSLLAFASFWTLISIISAVSTGGLYPVGGLNGVHIPTNQLFTYSIPLAGSGWVGVGLVLFQGRIGGRRSQVKNMFEKMGFGSEVYDLMIGMRGSGSRLSLLQQMESPKHRLELSELTGIDWKEVDRQISVLEKYGLVKVYAQSGTVKLYQVTEHGKLLLNLVAELNSKSLR